MEAQADNVKRIFDPRLYLDTYYNHLRQPEEEGGLSEFILKKLHAFLNRGGFNLHAVIVYIYNRCRYVIVIARGQGFMAVNEPGPRAKSEDKVCRKSLATRAITAI